MRARGPLLLVACVLGAALLPRGPAELCLFLCGFLSMALLDALGRDGRGR